MAVIGSAELKIVPKFDGLQKSLDSEMSRAIGKSSKKTARDWERSGEEGGAGFARGMGKSSVLFAAATAATTKAIDSIGTHVGDAASRFDTLNNYPKVMESLGYSAADAQGSIEKMSDRLSTLPTRLDDMVSTVKGLSVFTGDLDKATDAGLALNDMLLASGSNTQLTTAAMEQFRQMLAKGKPEMEDWKSLTAAMPGQMDQLAKSMLGPTAGASDLYEALGGGGGEATISMQQLLDQIIKLDREGGSGFESFRKQAETATGGVQTSMANMSNAITKGITGTMDAIGRENIAGAFNGVKDAINGAFGAVNGALSKAMPTIKTMSGNLLRLAPQAIAAAVAFKGFTTVAGGVKKAGAALKAASDGGTALAGATKLLTTALNPAKLALMAVAAGAALLTTAFVSAKVEQKNFEKATRGLSDAVGDSANLKSYADTLDNVGRSAAPAAMGVDELAKSMGKHVDTIAQNNQAAETQIATLNSVQSIIGECVGKTDLNADAQGRLNWALKQLNEQYGLNISAADVANGKYLDQHGKVMSVKDAVDQLCEAKKREARSAALTDNLTEAYSAQSEAAQTLAGAQKQYNDKVDWFMRNVKGCTEEQAKQRVEQSKTAEELHKAEEAYGTASEAVSNLEGELGLATQATAEGADALTQWAGSTSELFRASLEQNGTSINMMCEDLRTLGVDTEQLATLTPEQLNTLAWSYDGTMGSIAGALQNAGVNMSNLSATTSAESGNMLTAIFGLGDGVAAGVAGMGYNLGDLANKLVGAGVTTGQLRSIGGANFSALAQSCGGNIDQMVAKIQQYNDKDMEKKDSEVDVEHGSLDSANAGIEKFKKQPKDLGTKEGHVNIFQSVINTVKNVITGGGEGPGHASGGVRLHASGGISTRGTGPVIATQAVPLDIVGEDGAEAIVPLTNKRYSQPFVDLIAEGVTDRMGGDAGVTAARMVIEALPSIISEYTPVMGRRDFTRAVNKAVGANA